MKNTELVKVKGIMKFKGELDKVKPLTLERYTVPEAAQYFGCARSQIKGYHNNYRTLFGNNIVVEGPEGKQRTVLNKDAMFLMAILLNNKSKVAEQTFKNVLTLLLNEKAEENKETAKDAIKEEQMTLDEVATTVEDKVCEKEEKEINSKVNNVINIEDLKKAKKESVDMTCLKINITPEGTRITPIELSKKEAKDFMKNNKFNSAEEMPEELKNLFSNIASRIAEQFSDDEETCRCPECLEEEFTEASHTADMQKLLAQSTLETEVVITENYMKKCEILGVNKLEAAIMIQESIIDGDLDIDSKILDYLIKEKSSRITRDIGVIKESMYLLAEEKFDNLQDAYIILAQEMRYELGKDLTELAKQGQYNDLVKTIVVNDEFCSAMNIIQTYLTE